MASIDLDCPLLSRQSSDLNDPPPTEVSVDAKLQPAPEMNGTQVTLRGTSNRLDTASGQSEDLANLEEVLRGAWSPPGPTSAGSKEIGWREKSAGDEGYLAQNDCNEALNPGSRRGISRETPILLGDHFSEDEDSPDHGREACSSSEDHGHDRSTLEEHERKHTGERAEEKGPWSAPASSSSDVNGTNDTDEVMSDLEFARLRSLPAPVFRPPPFWQDFQQRKNTTSSDRSSGAGDSQDDPLVIDDDGGKTGESSASTRATSVEPEIGTASSLSSHRREELKTLDCLDAPTTPDPPVESFDRPTSPDVALPPHLVQQDDKPEEKADAEPHLKPSRGRSGDVAFGWAGTQKSRYAAACGHSAKRDRQALRSGSSNAIPHTDYDDTDDDDDIRPLLKKRTSRYPSGSHGKPLVVQGEEPDTLTERTPPQTVGIIPKAGHADTQAGYITPTSSPKWVMDHQPHPIVPSPCQKRASKRKKAIHSESQQWEVKNIVDKRWTGRGWEYQVVWASSWLPRSELGNARRLLRKFESQDLAQQKSRRDRSARDSSSED